MSHGFSALVPRSAGITLHKRALRADVLSLAKTNLKAGIGDLGLSPGATEFQMEDEELD